MHNNLNIQYNPSYSISFSTEVETLFEEEWKRKLKTAKEKNILLFNGPLFHVAGIETNDENVYLNLGNTDYRAYVCSRGIEFRNKFPDYAASKPLAACVAIVTSDNKLLLEKRKGVDVHEGMYHVVGGFLDPSKDIEKSGNPDPFGCVIREVKEETGLVVSRDQLTFLGLSEDIIIPHFELCYYSKLSMNSDELLGYLQSSLTDGEFNEPILIDLSTENIIMFLKSNEGLISPTGKACIEMMLSKIYNE